MAMRGEQPAPLGTPPARAQPHHRATDKPHHSPKTPATANQHLSPETPTTAKPRPPSEAFEHPTPQPTTIGQHRSPTTSHAPEEVLDRLYCSDTEEESPGSRHINERAFKTEDRKQQHNGDSTSGDTAPEHPRRIPSVVIKPSTHRVSYKDALLNPRTFKPRFPSVLSDHIKQA
ncbi:hypothetical protein SEVIR_9G476933v4 [Setaria viridis]